MKMAIFGIVSVAVTGVYFASGSGTAHHERIVDASPREVFNALAKGATDFEGQKNSTAPGADGKSYAISYKVKTEPYKFVSVVASANGAEIANIELNVEPAPEGKTKLTAEVDLDGAPVGLKPQFHMMQMAAGRAVDMTVASIENGMNPSLKGWDYAEQIGGREHRDAMELHVREDDPTAGVIARRRDRQEEMRAAARPMVDVSRPAHHEYR